ncbi:hypothetical protein [Williamsia sp. 1135]|uniref:hypothetical protein n=1 Tax=Williamsia sp. 1135 TaxID=1889262 RepID=UPI000A1123C2|nr:hypothetical protein [Williamsia sp. 1135]ORM36217.1 hypothetical protein BFL43_07750 [Williamsia sp. 1135]
MAFIVLAEPAPPSQPLPPDADDALNKLLGYGMWLGLLGLLTCLIVGSTLFWVAWRHGLGRGAKKVGWVLFCTVMFSAAFSLSGFFLTF